MPAKLVRSRVPEIMTAAGDTPKVRKAESDIEFRALLRNALLDNLTEYVATADRRKLADLAGVIFAIAHHDDINLDRLVRRRYQEYGGYLARMVIEGDE